MTTITLKYNQEQKSLRIKMDGKVYIFKDTLAETLFKRTTSAIKAFGTNYNIPHIKEE